MVTYISKSNNIDQQNLTKPGTEEGKTVLLIIISKHWDGPHLPKSTRSKVFTCTLCSRIRNLFTRTITQASHSTMVRKCLSTPNGMIVKEIPQILVELDPSYNITKDLRPYLVSAISARRTPIFRKRSTSTGAGKRSEESTET